MLKITPTSSPTGERLVLEGKISGPWVAELQSLCEAALNDHRRLTLDLTHVSYISIDGISLFRLLLRREVMLVGASSFVTEQLKNTR
jgi:hypothetical protein